MRTQPIPAEAGQTCQCCQRTHRKLYHIDGYWMGETCAQHYDLFVNRGAAGRDITSIYWRGWEAQYRKVAAMVRGPVDQPAAQPGSL